MDLRRALPTIGLVTLLVLDLVLVVWALWPSGRNAPAAVASTPSSSTSFSGEPSESASASPSSSASPSASKAPSGPTPLTLVLAAVDDRTAWLATTGTCDEPGRVAVTTDGGATWTASDAPGAVTRVRPSGRNDAFVVGGNAACAMRLWTTRDAGGSWGDAASASSAWARDARDERRVIRPGNDAVTPCGGKTDVLDLASLGRQSASVLCADGKVRTSTDGGDSWPSAFTAKGSVAFALLPDGRGALAGRADDCDGVSVTTLSGGSPGRSTCVEGAAADPGQVAVSVTDAAVWLVAGDVVYTAPEAAGPWTRTKGRVRS